MSYVKEKQEIIFWGTQLHQHGINYGRSGNMSMRVGDKTLVTAHESYLGFLNEGDILIMDKEGNIMEGNKEPTSEKILHLFV
jgi:L-fuculose-phosphate aldolase